MRPTDTTMAEQLRPLQSRLRKRSAAVETVSQVSLHLVGTPMAKEFEQARQIALEWLAERAGRPLPKEAWAGRSFELEEIGSQRVAAESLDREKRYWAARIDDADGGVPRRSWVTEIGIGEADGVIVLGARLNCVTRGADEPYDRTVPKFVRRIVQSCSATLDARRLTLDPWCVDSQEEVEALLALLESSARKSDVIVFSFPGDRDEDAGTEARAREFYRKVMGTAHVCMLTSSATYRLSDLVGKPFSVFQGAIRTYRPGFDFVQGDPRAHPLAFAHRIAAWPEGGIEGYLRFLADQTIARSVSVRDRDGEVPGFSTVRQVVAQRRLAKARREQESDAALLKLAEEEIAALKSSLDQQREEYEGLLETAESERAEALTRESAASAQVNALRRRVESLERRLASTSEANAEQIPDSLDDFEMWCEQALTGFVDVHTRAFQGIKKSVFSDVPLIYKSLLLLRDHYVPMRRDGGLELKTAFDEACRKLGLEESATFSGPGWGEQGDEYFVKRYGQRRLLERHLKNGGSRDPRRCLRVYFYWDDQEEQVVVGWLPSHLNNRQT